MPDHKFLLRRVALGLALGVCASVAGADALIKPVPQPDARKLAPNMVKELADARADFEKTRVALFGDRLAAAYAQLGALYLRTGFPDAAAVALYDAAQLAPRDARWLYVSGVIAREQKKNADAKIYFENALAIDKEYPPIRFRLADTLADMGDLDGARKVLLEGVADPKSGAAGYAFLASVELRQKRYAEAIDHFQQALKIEPKATSLNKDLADAYTAKGDASTAATYLAKTGDAPPTVDDPIVAGIYRTSSTHLPPTGTPLQQARQLLDQQQFALARTELDVALKTNSDDVEALALAARIDALLGKKAAAQEEVARALKLKPDNASANLSQGMLYEFAGDDGKAAAYYQRAAQADPNLPDPHLLLGNHLMRAGKFFDAAEQFRKLAAISLDGTDTDARISAALFAAGRCRDALNTLNGTLTNRSRDGDLLQVFVRVASTCPVATAQERSMALDYGQALYKQRPNAADTTALALAQAANGKFEDAQKSQAEAIFEAERARDAERAKSYRDVMHQFAAKQVPDKPWPADSQYFKPRMLAPLPAATAK